MLKSGSLKDNPEKQAKYYQMIADESNRLKLQVEKVLQMAQFDKNEIDLSLSQQNINALIERAATGVQLLLDEKNGKIHFDLQATNSDMKVDELHITNIMRNLLDNAIKYCDKIPKITITTTDSKKGITISVRDNGIGINSSQKKQVFEKFYRIPTGNLHNVKGFGLGLYYVKSLVLAHHGAVNVESTESGSKFTLFLPYLK